MTDVPPIITAPPPIVRPVSSMERAELLDVLRGFALFGILLVNMDTGVLLGSGPLDQWATWVIRFFAEGKFYPLFSLLFGIGMVMQLQRAEERGVSFPRLHIRRMLVLLCIGVIHGFFIWEGDILMLYALLGMVLVAFRKCKPKTLAIWIVVCLTAERFTSEFSLGDQNIQNFANGSLGEVMLQRAKNTLYIYSMSFVAAPIIFAMFLVGLYVGRRGILKNAGEHLPLFRRTLTLGLCIAIPGNLLMVGAQEFATGSGQISWGWSTASSFLLAIACPVLMLVYVAAIALLFQRQQWRARLLLLAPVGRMALSNYLLQSLVCTTLFYSYGFGLFGSVGHAAGVGMAIGIFLLQIPFSTWWLRRFQFGPAEWFWRSLTYGRRQPMRRPVLVTKSAI